MRTYIFILTMPNNNSWNGKWSGEGKLYCAFRKIKEKDIKIIERLNAKQNYYYNFGDGWGANVEVRQIAGKEITSYKKRSKGFCGYDWMIGEIIRHGRILTRDERLKKEVHS